MTRYAMSGVASGKEQAYLVDVSMSRIWLRNQNLSHFGFESLYALPSVSEIFLDFNEIKEVDLEPLTNHKSLRVLSLSGNKIKSIDLTPLKGCRNLRWLSLSNNRLETVDISPLARCNNLEYLYLSGNKLTSIDLRPLANTGLLKEIILSKGLIDSLDTIIDLTPFVKLRKLKRIGLHELERVSLGLQADQFRRVPSAVSACLSKCRNVSIEQIVKSRIDTLGPKRGLESLELELESIDSQYWLSVRKDILTPLGLHVIAGYDGKISDLAPIKRKKNWEESILIKASEAIAKGSRSTLLNLEELDMKIGVHAKLHSSILENRINELKQVRVFVCEGCADFREVWYTAWGFKLLSEYKSWFFGNSGKPLIALRDHLRELGFDLEFVSVRIRDPWPTAKNEPSTFLRRTILGSADRTATPNMKKKALQCILKSNLHPLRGQYEKIVTELNDRRGDSLD
ncbi:MAG: leucine-rich repeat domain-containing protein [Candidatus Thorarchaeota archaeon]|jgi:hypothetical protein